MARSVTISSLEQLEEVASTSGESPVRVSMPSITKFKDSSRISKLLSEKARDSRWEVKDNTIAALDLASDRSLDLMCFKRSFRCLAIEIKSGRGIERSQLLDLRRHLTKMAPYSENTGCVKILEIMVQGQSILRLLEKILDKSLLAEGRGDEGNAHLGDDENFRDPKDASARKPATQEDANPGDDEILRDPKDASASNATIKEHPNPGDDEILRDPKDTSAGKAATKEDANPGDDKSGGGSGVGHSHFDPQELSINNHINLQADTKDIQGAGSSSYALTQTSQDDQAAHIWCRIDSFLDLVQEVLDGPIKLALSS